MERQRERRQCKEVKCKGCLELLSGGPSYTCHINECNFKLHKSCAELSRQTHHPEHPLTLSGVPAEYRLARRCYACKHFSMGFAYTCSVCKFNIDIICSQKSQTIKHTKHQHPLTTLRTALFLCDACGLEHEGVSYLSSTCKFWINQSCASPPDTVKHVDHDHPLTICYSFPQEYYDFVTRCDICSENLNKTYWTYFCAKCRYFAHLNCATAATATSQEEQFGNKPSLPNETENTKACNACVQPISAPFYHCAQCKFFLHQSCAELPLEVRHSSHLEHPLTLLARHPFKFGLFRCEGCGLYCNGFTYNCSTCKFYLNVRCGSLPGAIIHEAHRHPLILTKKRDS
ncbi:unnamed protein product [Camellia sinensis]